MNSHSRSALAGAAVIALACLVAAAPAAAQPVGGAVASAKKKPRNKAVKCKKSQVRVKIGKRRACQKKALPKPKAGDPRLLLARSATGDWSRLRSRRGKRLPSMPKLIRKLGPRAPTLLNRVTARGIARVDALSAPAVAATARAAQSAECNNLDQAPRQRDTFTQRDGGTTATATATVGPDGASLGIELRGNEFTVSVDINLGICEPNEVQAPQCPSAVGRLDGEIRYRMKVAIQVSRRGEDVWSQSAEVQRRTKLQGWADTDAKLDRLNVDDIETSTFRLGGSSRDYPPITIRTKLVRRAEVDMRSGAYTPDRSDISVTFTMDGLGGPDRAEAEDDVAERSRAEADRNFRAIVEKAIGGYRSRESRWQEANVCATLQLDPTSNSRPLRPGQAGAFNATAIAHEDGAQSELDATLSGQVNASFSPTRAGGQRATFNYNVAGGARGKVTVTVRATSKAGVVRDTWEQPIEEAEEYHYRILNASYSENLLGQANNPDSACGLSGVTTSFTQMNGMNVTGPAFESSNRLELGPNGELNGQIAVSAMGTASGTINGCDIDEPPPFPACTQPFGGELMGAVVLVISIAPNSGTATLTWPMPNLGGNFIGAEDPSCQPDPFRFASDPNPLPTQEVPAAVFKATTPQTLTFHRFRSGQSAPQTTISSTVDYSITFVRVRPDGAPL